MEVAIRIKADDSQTIFNTETLNVVNQIPDEVIKSHVLLNQNFFFNIKENCYKRVKENFTWSIVTKKLALLYLDLLQPIRN